MLDTFARLLRHLCYPSWRLRRLLPKQSMDAITRAIQGSERDHAGEVRVAIENNLGWGRLVRRVSPRERAIEVFSALRVWDTEHNNGVLIYLLLADRAVEIIADRGVERRVEPGEWQRICRAMEAEFRQGDFEAGLIGGIQAIGEHLVRHFGGADPLGNELPDQPVVLRR